MPIFLELKGFDSDHTQETIDRAVKHADIQIVKVVDASSPKLFLQAENSHGFKHTINALSDTFLKLGTDFQKIDDSLVKVDEFLLKVAPPAPSAEGAPNPQADFLKVASDFKVQSDDLKVLAADFHKLDTAPDLATWKVDALDVSADFQKLSTDSSDTATAVNKLATDVLELARNPDNSMELDAAYKFLGGQLLKVSAAFDTIKIDFGALNGDFAVLGGGVTTTAGLVAEGPPPMGPLGTDFAALDKDFLVLNQALGGDGLGLNKLVDAFVDQTLKAHSDPDQPGQMFAANGGSGHG